MKNKIITFDFDGLIAESCRAITALYNDKYNDNQDYTKNTKWSFEDVCPKSNAKEINSWFSTIEFFARLEPISGVIELMKELYDLGYKIAIVTCHRPEGIYLKSKWIEKYIDFSVQVVYIELNEDEVIDKSLISSWIHIDDSISALDTINSEYKICFGDYKYNDTDKYIKVKDAKELRKEIFKIIN